jgi:hypothetical protein
MYRHCRLHHHWPMEHIKTFVCDSHGSVPTGPSLARLFALMTHLSIFSSEATISRVMFPESLAAVTAAVRHICMIAYSAHFRHSVQPPPPLPPPIVKAARSMRQTFPRHRTPTSNLLALLTNVRMPVHASISSYIGASRPRTHTGARREESRAGRSKTMMTRMRMSMMKMWTEEETDTRICANVASAISQTRV